MRRNGQGNKTRYWPSYKHNEHLCCVEGTDILETSYDLHMLQSYFSFTFLEELFWDTVSCTVYVTCVYQISNVGKNCMALRYSCYSEASRSHTFISHKFECFTMGFHCFYQPRDDSIQPGISE